MTDIEEKVILRKDIEMGKWYCIRAIDNLDYLYQIKSIHEEALLFANHLEGVQIWIWNTKKEAIKAIREHAIEMVNQFGMLEKECAKQLEKITKRK